VSGVEEEIVVNMADYQRVMVEVRGLQGNSLLHSWFLISFEDICAKGSRLRLHTELQSGMAGYIACRRIFRRCATAHVRVRRWEG
jgi:hypothetical protein